MTPCYILIASDIPLALTKIIEKVSVLERVTCVTATRLSDCITMSKSLQPTLIIAHYRDPENSLKCLFKYNNRPETAIICLTRPHEVISENAPQNATLFIQSFEDAISNDLAMNVKSILKLLQSKKETVAAHYDSLIPAHHNKNLARYTLELDQKVAMLNRLKEKLRYLAPHTNAQLRPELLSMIQTIKLGTGNQSHWEDFKMYFESVNPNFLEKLSHAYPMLTGKDLKYCCYLKMNMSNNDIRRLLGINQESVRTHKYRLKKKMTLPKEQNLYHYLQSFAS